FRKKCLRACISLNGSSEGIKRTDNFIISLIREHFLQASKIEQFSIYYYEKTLYIEFISSEAFLYLNRKGYIQDNMEIPLIYHSPRHNSNKKLEYPQHLFSNNRNITWRYSMTTPNRENLKKTKKFYFKKGLLLSYESKQYIIAYCITI
ncbi:hypothetical protein ALC62_05525, partial [Cyphomyrmex costatus]